VEKLTVTLDKERELKFTFRAFSALARDCKVNVNDPDTFRGPMDPDKLSAFVWAGQLHTKDR
jgi:hypothetical protein